MAPLYETSPQKRSDMERVVKEGSLFFLSPTRLSTMKMKYMSLLKVKIYLCTAGLLSCYYQPRADDLLGTYYYQSLSSTMDTPQDEDEAEPGLQDGAVGRRWRGVVARRLLVLAAVCFALAIGVVCRLTI